MKSKNKIVHSRCTEDIYEKLYSSAKKHWWTVSTMVRDIIEDFFDVSESVWYAIDWSIRENFLKKKKDKIIWFQEFENFKELECNFCEKKISKWEKAFFVMFDNTNNKSIICSKCKNNI